MSRGKAPVTTAVRELRAHKVRFTDHLYIYEEHGGTAVSARDRREIDRTLHPGNREPSHRLRCRRNRALRHP